MTKDEALKLALAWYDSGLEVREEFQEMIESILAQPQQEHPAQQEPDYAWPTVADYEKDVGIEVNQVFKMAWNMARTTNKMMGITSPPQRTWVGLMRGVRVEGDTVIITVKGGNNAARELCGELVNEIGVRNGA